MLTKKRVSTQKPQKRQKHCMIHPGVFLKPRIFVQNVYRTFKNRQKPFLSLLETAERFQKRQNLSIKTGTPRRCSRYARHGIRTEQNFQKIQKYPRKARIKASERQFESSLYTLYFKSHNSNEIILIILPQKNAQKNF